MAKYFYVYYSYEEFGRGYIGKRECKCLPEEDVKYFGTYRDKTFKPTQKIILEVFSSREEVMEAEIKLHNFYEETKKMMSENKKGKPAPNKGKPHSEETKQKIRKKRREQIALKKSQQGGNQS